MITTKNLYLKIIAAGIIGILMLTLPFFIIDKPGFLADQPLYKHLVRSLFVGLISIGGIWLLRSKIFTKPPISIGLGNAKKAIVQFLFGFCLIAVPLIITVVLSIIFGWSEVSFNFSAGILFATILGLISTFFTDAISEELIFRGFIYGSLKSRFNKWTSSLVTTILFVSLIVIVVTIQQFLGIQTGLQITGGYLITLFIFGAFVQYLRVLTKSIWVGVGFHLFFVQMNQLIGLSDNSLIQLSGTESELPAQITLISLLALVFIGLIAYSFIQKRKQANIEVATS